jgi:hypothetical protein
MFPLYIPTNIEQINSKSKVKNHLIKVMRIFE